MDESNQKIEKLIMEINTYIHSEPEKAEKLIDQLGIISNQLLDYKNMAKTHNLKGIIKVEKGDHNEGIKEYMKALNISYQNGIEEIRPAILNNLGAEHNLIGNYVVAIEHFTNALSLIYKNNMKKDYLSTIYSNIADAYIGIFQPQKALEYLDQVKENINISEYELNYTIYANYAEAYFLLKQPEKAFTYILWFEESIKLKNQKVFLTFIDYLKARYFELLDLPKDSDVFYKSALNAQLESNQFYYYPKIALDYIKFLDAHGRCEESITVIKQAIDLAISKNWEYVLSDYYCYLSKSYRALDQSENAYKATELYFIQDKKNKDKLNQYQLQLINTRENLLAMEVKNNNLTQSVHSMKTLNNILKRINTIHDMNQMVEVLYGEIKNILKMDSFSLGLLDEENQKLIYIAKFEDGKNLGASQVSYTNKKSFSIWVKNNQKPLIIPDAEDFDYIKTNYEAVKFSKSDVIQNGNYSKSVVIWPLLINNEIIGVMNIQSIMPHAFDSYDFEIIEMLSSHLAIAIKNNQQHQELNTMIEKLNELSFIDSLTGVYNRQAFNEFLPSLYTEAVTKQQNLVFAMLDLDNFKALNDTLGHQEGDQCLQDFGKLLKGIVGEIGYAYRYGGDEFSLLFMGIELEVVDSILEEICQKSTALYTFDHHMSVSTSIGAVFVDHGKTGEMTIQQFINYADNALYIAKNEGKNTYKRVIV